ncbi:MAG TPA: peptidylprolyl isomerase [Pirellulaceae bacterium]|jgi:cyclophilin family peptidyl-prolyl cis-trans isomerase|nr:peptidylprolyl isomerase [Pirellulaceae bacterium]
MQRFLWPQQLLVAFVLVLFVGCGKGDSSTAATDAAKDKAASTSSGGVAASANSEQSAYIPQPSIYVNAVGPIEKPIVVVHTSAGDVRIELEIEKSPQTVLNFLENYVRRGFYEQTIFHHADSAFVVAGGFTAELEQKPTANPIYNEGNNGLSNVRGAVSMSRDPNAAHSATSQFLINVVDNSDLDYQGDDADSQRGYCVFGRVIEGMEVIDQIAASNVREEGDFQRLPVDPVIITSVEELP